MAFVEGLFSIQTGLSARASIPQLAGATTRSGFTVTMTYGTAILPHLHSGVRGTREHVPTIMGFRHFEHCYYANMPAESTDMF